MVSGLRDSWALTVSLSGLPGAEAHAKVDNRCSSGQDQCMKRIQFARDVAPKTKTLKSISYTVELDEAADVSDLDQEDREKFDKDLIAAYCVRAVAVYEWEDGVREVVQSCGVHSMFFDIRTTEDEIRKVAAEYLEDEYTELVGKLLGLGFSASEIDRIEIGPPVSSAG